MSQRVPHPTRRPAHLPARPQEPTIPLMHAPRPIGSSSSTVTPAGRPTGRAALTTFARWGAGLLPAVLSVVVAGTSGCCKLMGGGGCGGSKQHTANQEASVRAKQAAAERDAAYRRMLAGDAAPGADPFVRDPVERPSPFDVPSGGPGGRGGGREVEPGTGGGSPFVPGSSSGGGR